VEGEKAEEDWLQFRGLKFPGILYFEG